MELTLDQALQKGIEAHKAGKVQEADRCYTAILKANPKHPDANHNMGVLAVDVGKVQEALPFFKEAVEANPKIAQYWLSYADALMKNKNFSIVDQLLIDIKNKSFDKITLDKLEHKIYLKKALTYQSQNEFEKAEVLFKKLIENDKSDPEAYIHLGLLYRTIEDPLRSLDTFNLAQRAFPFLPQVYTNACEVCEKYNMLKEFSQWMTKAEDTFDDLPIELEYSKLVLKFRSFEYIEVDNHLTSEFIAKLDDDRKILALEMSAKSNDFLGNYKKAIISFNKMNRRMKNKYQKLEINSEKKFNYYENQIQYLRDFPNTDVQNDPILEANISVSFILGFPRSGSTLISKMLNAHPWIECLDEYPLITRTRSAIDSEPEITNPLIFSKKNKILGRQYYEKIILDNFAKNSKNIFIDKRPLNIFELPSISQFFPEAKILCLVRHPCDVIISCWMQNFGINSVMSITTSIKELTRFYCLSMKTLVETQEKLQPNISYLKYEDFITSPRTSLTKYLAEIGLDWAHEIDTYREQISKTEYISTPSYHQVVQPIYTNAIYRWENYKDLLKDYADDLNPWIKWFKYKNNV